MRRIAVAALTAVLALGLAPAAGAAGVAATATGPARTAYDGQTYGGCLGVTIVVDFGDLDGAGQRGGVIQCEPTTGRALDVLQAYLKRREAAELMPDAQAEPALEPDIEAIEEDGQ